MTDQARGNFRINLNRNKKPGDSQPMFERGIISTPEDPETQYELKLWAYKDKKGKTFYAGPSSHVSVAATALERADALMTEQAAGMDTAAIAPDGSGLLQLREHQVMLFENGYKVKEGDPRFVSLSEAEREVNAKRPDVWGYWNPGNGKPQLKVAAWDIKGRYGPFLGGNTQVPQPGKNIAMEAQAEPALAEPAPRSRGKGVKASR